MSIWVYIEHFQGQPVPVALELLGRAATLAAIIKQQATAVVLGEMPRAKLELLWGYGAHRIIYLPAAELHAYNSDVQPVILTDLARQYKPLAIICGATSTGRALAPAVAARLQTGCAADCSQLEIDPQGNLLQTVPAFNGSIMAQIITPRHRPQIATVRPGVYPIPPCKPRQGELEVISYPLPAPRLTVDYRSLKSLSDSLVVPIHEAQVVVGGGAGVKDLSGWQMLHQLAAQLGGAVGGTRPAADEGFIPSSHMIGQSGITIRPRLYIAVGISGEMQHIVGIKDAGCIVAINNDPAAPIFRFADYNIIADYREFIPAWLEQLQKTV
ncbi:electron transfer flavoprotein subunit alpha/FixB family protein [Desulfurispora thermophila]|uniref:electron transfer flavoprotein subunit alpha/FixB family protein n=1 Tax=Desulfurispora thermophila TaxID=265470 RepID=UPI0003674397|nr:electron transfer flavoprotein subunit alpha/FixB family protein [Desulfurispora thermophila]